MKKRATITLAAAVVALTVATAVRLANRPTEPPIYSGRPLTDWLKELKDFDTSKKRAAEQVVAGLGTNDIPNLIRMLKLKDPRSKSDSHLYENWKCRQNAAYLLGRLGPQAKRAVPHLARLLRDRLPEVRYYSAQALGRIGPEAHQAVPNLRTLKTSGPDGGTFADWALEEIQSKPHSEAVLTAMTRATTNFDNDIAEPAVVCLRDAGFARRALPPLLEMLSVKGTGPYKDSDSWDIYPTFAADRIALLGPEAKEAIGPLTAALNDPSAMVKLTAARALGEIGPDGRVALPVLVALAGAKDGKGWQGMDDNFWRATVTRAISAIAPDSATNNPAK